MGIFLDKLFLKAKVDVIVDGKIPGMSRCVGADVLIAGEGLSAVECRAADFVYISVHFLS